MQDAAVILHQDFIRRLKEEDLPQRRTQWTLQQSEVTAAQLVQLFESQITSRLLDYQARQLKARGECYYTIGSAGHEGNAALAAALEIKDAAYLHYRSAAFVIERSKQLPGQTPIWDFLLSFSASSEDPISGGRHKVLGSKALNIPPQTSTIASHLPKAVGAAMGIPMAARLEIANRPAEDSLVFCNFGDASANHATAQSAFNLASWCAYQHIPLPMIFVCEDNGIGISVKTPKNWIHANFHQRPGLKYMQCDGLDVLDTYQCMRDAQAYVRKHQKPVFLHMKTVRLMGHAGADAEIAYRDKADIQAGHDNCPLLHSSRILMEQAGMSPSQILDLYLAKEAQIAEVAEKAITRPKIASAQGVMSSLVPEKQAIPPLKGLDNSQRRALFAAEKTAFNKPQPLGRMINFALAELMAERENVLVFGEDVAKKGGVYHVTARLREKFGPKRVFNSLLDETSILGAAIGLSQDGFLPIPEIQFLAYVHNAEDQIRGEAATLSFFSNRQFSNPMVIRIAGLAYQKGFGGHFHNDNSLAVFRDIPGVVMACPSRGKDAVAMLRECVRLAQSEGRVVIFIEPIALYMTRDLHETGDEAWADSYPDIHSEIAVGELGVTGNGKEVCLVSFGNGHYLCQQAAKVLEDTHDIQARVIDIRWIAPLNKDALIKQMQECEHVLFVDETRETGSVSEALMTMAFEAGFAHDKVARLCAKDSFIPLAGAANLVLPGKGEIIDRALSLVGKVPLSLVEGG